MTSDGHLLPHDTLFSFEINGHRVDHPFRKLLPFPLKCIHRLLVVSIFNFAAVRCTRYERNHFYFFFSFFFFFIFHFLLMHFFTFFLLLRCVFFYFVLLLRLLDKFLHLETGCIDCNKRKVDTR